MPTTQHGYVVFSVFEYAGKHFVSVLHGNKTTMQFITDNREEGLFGLLDIDKLPDGIEDGIYSCTFTEHYDGTGADNLENVTSEAFLYLGPLPGFQTS